MGNSVGQSHQKDDQRVQGSLLRMEPMVTQPRVRLTLIPVLTFAGPLGRIRRLRRLIQVIGDIIIVSHILDHLNQLIKFCKSVDNESINVNRRCCISRFFSLVLGKKGSTSSIHRDWFTTTSFSTIGDSIPHSLEKATHTIETNSTHHGTSEANVKAVVDHP